MMRCCIKKCVIFRKNVYDRQTILLGDVQSLLQSNFNASWPVKFYGGGWPGGDGAAFRIRKKINTEINIIFDVLPRDVYHMIFVDISTYV
jgi:hypothetical protein